MSTVSVRPGGKRLGSLSSLYVSMLTEMLQRDSYADSWPNIYLAQTLRMHWTKRRLTHLALILHTSDGFLMIYFIKTTVESWVYKHIL